MQTEAPTNNPVAPASNIPCPEERVSFPHNIINPAKHSERHAPAKSRKVQGKAKLNNSSRTFITPAISNDFLNGVISLKFKEKV